MNKQYAIQQWNVKCERLMHANEKISSVIGNVRANNFTPKLYELIFNRQDISLIRVTEGESGFWMMVYFLVDGIAPDMQTFELTKDEYAELENKIKKLL